MTKYCLSFRIQRESGGGFSTRCIEFPGIITQGHTESELVKMIQDVVVGYFEVFPDELEKLEHIQKNKLEKPQQNIPQIEMNESQQCITQSMMLKINA